MAWSPKRWFQFDVARSSKPVSGMPKMFEFASFVGMAQRQMFLRRVQNMEKENPRLSNDDSVGSANCRPPAL
jgi:hypothetical protein